MATRMGDKQIQTINNRDYALARRSRPRGLVGQMGMVLLEPGAFFHALPYADGSRQWVWAALLILALVGISAVRQDALLNGDDTNLAALSANTSVPMDPFASSGPFGGGGQLPAVPTEPVAPSQPDVSATWTIALIAGSGVVLGWFILAVMLCEVSLFNGVAPRLGSNFQIAIWTSVPLGLMAALQLLFYAAGGTVGEPGISGLLGQWDGYAGLPAFIKSLTLSFASHLTLFWLWSVILIYIAGRRALNGKTWAVALVVVAWVVVVVVAPVLTGAIAAPDTETTLPDMSATSGDEMPTDLIIPPESAPPDFAGGSEGGQPAGDPLAEPSGPETTLDAPASEIAPSPTPSAGGRMVEPPASRSTEPTPAAAGES